VYGGPVTDFGWRGPFGGEQGAVAVFVFPPLVIGACHVGPEPAAPLGGGDGGRPQGLGVLDGGPVVAEDLRDAHLVQRDVRAAERGEPVIGVPPQPGSGGVGLADVLTGGRSSPVHRGGVGSHLQEAAIHRQFLSGRLPAGLGVADGQGPGQPDDAIRPRRVAPGPRR
jgi:hypothetical protein